MMDIVDMVVIALVVVFVVVVTSHGLYGKSGQIFSYIPDAFIM